MNLFIVHHVGPTGEKLTAHKTLSNARQSAQKRQGSTWRAMTGAIIYEIDSADLREVETHGRLVPEQVPGQQPLF